MTDGHRWGRSSGALAVVGLYAALVAAAAGLGLAVRAVGLIAPDASWWLAPALVAIGLPTNQLLGGWVTGRHHRDHGVECAIRPAGSPRGRWQHGRVEEAGGALVFVPGGPGGIRVQRGTPRPFPVTRMSVDEGHWPGLRQAWSINPRLHVVVVTVDGRTLDLAALPDDLTRLRRIALGS